MRTKSYSMPTLADIFKQAEEAVDVAAVNLAVAENKLQQACSNWAMSLTDVEVGQTVYSRDGGKFVAWIVTEIGGFKKLDGNLEVKLKVVNIRKNGTPGCRTRNLRPPPWDELEMDYFKAYLTKE